MPSRLSFIFLSVLWISNVLLKNLQKCLKTTKRSWDQVNSLVIVLVTHRLQQSFRRSAMMSWYTIMNDNLPSK